MFTRWRLHRLRLWTSNCSLLLIYLPRKDERPSLPGWLPSSGRFTHKWSPVSCKSSTGQGKFAGQRPMFYYCGLQPTTECKTLPRLTIHALGISHGGFPHCMQAGHLHETKWNQTVGSQFTTISPDKSQLVPCPKRNMSRNFFHSVLSKPADKPTNQQIVTKTISFAGS